MSASRTEMTCTPGSPSNRCSSVFLSLEKFIGIDVYGVIHAGLYSHSRVQSGRSRSETYSRFGPRMSSFGLVTLTSRPPTEWHLMHTDGSVSTFHDSLR